MIQNKLIKVTIEYGNDQIDKDGNAKNKIQGDIRTCSFPDFNVHNAGINDAQRKATRNGKTRLGWKNVTSFESIKGVK